MRPPSRVFLKSNSIRAPSSAASFICSPVIFAGEVEGVGGDHVLHALAFRIAEDHQGNRNNCLEHFPLGLNQEGFPKSC
jgi:hypothetical protein